MATKKLSEAAKNVLRTQRRRLAEEAASNATRRYREAQSMLNREVQPKPIVSPRAPRPEPGLATTFARAVVPRVAAVLASERVTARVRVDLRPFIPMAGWTDFQQIVCQYPVHDDSDMAEVAAIVRGIAYHEGGHCRFTVRPDLLVSEYYRLIGNDRDRKNAIDQVWHGERQTFMHAWNLCEDQAMEAHVVEDSPAKAKYFAPMVLDVVLRTRQQKTLEEAKTEWEALMEALYTRGLIAGALPFNERAAAMQRVSGYPLIAWRRYIPRELRAAMRAEFIEVHGAAITRQIERLVLTYIRSANDVQKKVEAVLALIPLLKTVLVPPTDHDQIERGNGNRSRTGAAANDSAPASMDDAEEDYDEDYDEDDADDYGDDADDYGDDADDDGADGQGQDGADGQGQDGEDGEDGESDGEDGQGQQGQGQQGQGQDGEDGQDGAGQGQDEAGAGQGEEGDGGHTVDADGADGYSATGNGSHHDVTKALEEAKAAAEEARNNDSSVRGDVAAWNDARFSGTTGSMLDPYFRQPVTDGLLIGSAVACASEIVRAFQEVNMERQPTWQEGQTRGVLNVARYVNRQPGDREFFRSWSDEIAPGRNLAVSVLLDYSGSMASSEHDLSVVAYGMKAACDELNLPCTVTLWDHEATVLWDGMERAEFVPVISSAGGTCPNAALDDVQNQRFDKDAHIVLMMTDGQFSSVPNWLNDYRTEGTYFVGAIYLPRVSPEKLLRTEEQMACMGFDRYQAMNDLKPLARLLEEAIIEMAF